MSLGVQNHLGDVVDLGRPRRRRRRRQWLRILLERRRLRVRDHRLLDGLHNCGKRCMFGGNDLIEIVFRDLLVTHLVRLL